MILIRYLFIIIITFFIVTGYNSTLFSWRMFTIFKDTKFNKENLQKIKNFDPGKDLFYLPEIEGKTLFESIDDYSIFRKDDIRKYIYIYLTSARPYTIRAINQSYKYSDQISEIFKQNSDIPDEIAYLPLLESAFNPQATSKSNAVGVWQFVKNTSQPLGLRNDKWIDERKNIKKSTRAAIRHLRTLYNQFHSWELALLAYNGGAGYLKKVINKTKSPNIWTLIESDELRKETKEYLPRYLALLLIFKNQEMFGIKDEINPKSITDYTTFILKFPVHIKQISKITGISVKQIRELNPELKLNIIPPYLRNYSLKVPVQAKPILEKNKKKLSRYRYKRLKHYVIKKGDCISIIAQRYNKSPAEIMQFNNIKKPHLIKPGQVLYIPI